MNSKDDRHYYDKYHHYGNCQLKSCDICDDNRRYPSLNIKNSYQFEKIFPNEKKYYENEYEVGDIIIDDEYEKKFESNRLTTLLENARIERNRREDEDRERREKENMKLKQAQMARKLAEDSKLKMEREQKIKDNQIAELSAQLARLQASQAIEKASRNQAIERAIRGNGLEGQPNISLLTLAPPTVNEEDEEVKKLIAEKIKERQQCIVCMERDKCVVFNPCGHIVSCLECSNKLTQCPNCRANILEKRVVYY